MRALTDFLLRESLALLLDDPTPRNVAQSMGGAHARDAMAALALESQSQTEDESESQGLAGVATTTHRVMMVRSTDSSQQLVTLVDRSFSIDAFLPQKLIDELCRTRRYKSIAPLRGSVVQIVKYHFATPAQCRATQPSLLEQSRSVAMRHARRDHAKLWLFVDALVVIDDSELVVNEMPEVEKHSAVAKQLAAFPPAALEHRLALRQGLETVATEPRITPSPAKRFDDQNPLLDEDCEIPEDQERELDAQEGWGDHNELLVQPTDSQLIAENGPVSGGGESQFTSSDPTVGSSSSHTVVSSSSDAMSPSRRVIVSGTEPLASQEETQTQAHGESSVPDSQDLHFERVNLQKAFVDCSDTDSDSGEYEMAGDTTTSTPRRSQRGSSTPSKQLSSSQRTPKKTPSAATQDSQATETQSFPTPERASQQPLTQATGRSVPHTSSASPNGVMPKESQPPQARDGEFIGLDHDKRTASAGDEESRGLMRTADEANTQASEPSQSLEIPSDQETVDIEYEMGDHEGDGDTQVLEGTEEDDRGDRPSASQQDGQTDLFMDTQTQPPLNASPARPVRRSSTHLPSPSPSDGPDATQHRKRRRSTMATVSEARPLSPREPNTKAARVASAPSTATTASSSRTTPILGISSFNRKATDPQLQRLRPSKRYEHLLPPFDLDAVLRLICEKTE